MRAASLRAISSNAWDAEVATKPPNASRRKLLRSRPSAPLWKSMDSRPLTHIYPPYGAAVGSPTAEISLSPSTVSDIEQDALQFRQNDLAVRGMPVGFYAVEIPSARSIQAEQRAISRRNKSATDFSALRPSGEAQRHCLRCDSRSSVLGLSLIHIS